LGIFLTVFASIFLAELGDKTQLATMLFASNESSNKLIVLIAASCALIAVTALSVLAGAAISNYVGADALKRIAGVGFIVIGVLTIFSK
jgi:putative Ca2+/H+ antiporter (TMEM165/GDT1 family)